MELSNAKKLKVEEDFKDMDAESGTGMSTPATGGESGRSTPGWVEGPAA